MKTRNRIILAGIAGLLAGIGTTLSSAQDAAAEPAPKFPTCTGAKTNGGQLRVWINPGTLYSPKSLAVGGVKLDRRRDGIFTGIVAEPEESANNWILAKMDGTHKGFWVKCKKVTP